MPQANIFYCTLSLTTLGDTGSYTAAVQAEGYVVRPDDSVVMYPANSGHTVGGVVQLSLRVGLDYNESLEAVKDDIASQVLDALSAIGVTGSLKIVVLPLL